MGLMLFSPF